MLQNGVAGFNFDANSVEEIFVRDCAAKGAQTICKSTGQSVNALCDRGQPFWPVINRIHRRNDGEENLCCADVASGFVAADVLLACLQGEPVSGATLGIV